MLSSSLSLAANLERVDGSLGGLGGKLVKEVAGKMVTGALHGVAKANIPLLSGACELVGEAVEIVSEFARVQAEMREAAEWLRDQKLLFDGYNEKMQAQEYSAAQTEAKAQTQHGASDAHPLVDPHQHGQHTARQADSHEQIHGSERSVGQVTEQPQR